MRGSVFAWHPGTEETKMALFGDGDRRELEKKAKAEGRLPPGQSLTLKWPVLHYGSVPTFDAEKWDFKISGLVEEPVRLTWEEFRALPQTEVTSDFHCVTRWRRLDNRWKAIQPTSHSTICFVQTFSLRSNTTANH